MTTTQEINSVKIEKELSELSVDISLGNFHYSGIQGSGDCNDSSPNFIGRTKERDRKFLEPGQVSYAHVQWYQTGRFY